MLHPIWLVFIVFIFLVLNWLFAMTSKTSAQSSLIKADANDIHHSDSPSNVLVTSLLTGDNYGSWNRAMSVALRVNSKLGFVDGLLQFLKTKMLFSTEKYVMIWNEVGFSTPSRLGSIQVSYMLKLQQKFGQILRSFFTIQCSKDLPVKIVNLLSQARRNVSFLILDSTQIPMGRTGIHYLHHS